MIEFTEPMPGFTPPVRSGWYPVGRSEQARFDVGARAWSVAIDEAASEAEHAAARSVPMDPDSVRALQWRGLTEPSARWLSAELARGA